MNKLTPSDYRFVERMLYIQKTQKTAIAELEAELDDLIRPCSASILENSPCSSDKEGHTEKSVMNRMDTVKGKSLQSQLTDRRRQKKAIDEAIDKLDDTEAQLVWLRYDLEKSYRECMQIMGYEKSRFYELKNRVVLKVGRYLGL